jgi:hypothetical protein
VCERTTGNRCYRYRGTTTRTREASVDRIKDSMHHSGAEAPSDS